LEGIHRKARTAEEDDDFRLEAEQQGKAMLHGSTTKGEIY
jgi:hypothetical protein